MDMGNALAGVGAAVDHDPESPLECQLLGQLSRDDEEMAEDGLVRLRGVGQRAG